MACRRYFSVKHLGFECARREAILLRQQWKGDVNEEVLKALEEEKAAMDAAAAVSGGGGVPARTRGAAGEVQSPSLRPAPPVTPPVTSPSKLPTVGAGTDTGPASRKEKAGEKGTTFALHKQQLEELGWSNIPEETLSG